MFAKIQHFMKHIYYLLLLLPTIALSQNIKTKKDKVLFDDKEVAILKSSGDTYTFQSLDGKTQFSAKYQGLSEGTTVLYQWLEMKNTDESKSTEIPYEVLITSFSPSKIIIKLLSEKYGLINADGINTEKVKDFFDKEREKLSLQYTQTIVAAKEDAKINKAEYDAKIGKLLPSVKKDGTIVTGGELGTNIIGRATHSAYDPFNKNDFMFFTDLDGTLVAKAKITDNFNKTTVVTLFNGDTFSFNAKRSFGPSDAFIYFKEVVEQLVARDYVLGHQAKAYNANLHKEKVAVAKGKSASIYNQKGYVIDEKGTKLTGIINAEFEPLDVNEIGKTEVFETIDTVGKNVSIKYKNEKGKERTTTFSAKDNITFARMNDDGTETLFVGMKVKGDAMKKLSNAMSLGFNNAYFYEVLFEEKGNQVLIDPIKNDIFVIKLKAAAEGQMIDARNNSKLSTQLSEYLSACKPLVKEINDNVFDLKNYENLINIVKEFNVCQK